MLKSNVISFFAENIFRKRIFLKTYELLKIMHKMFPVEYKILPYL